MRHIGCHTAVFLGAARNGIMGTVLVTGSGGGGKRVEIWANRPGNTIGTKDTNKLYF